MKLQNLSVKRLFGRVAMGLVLSMSGITIVLFFVTKQTAVLLTGGALLLCALVGIFVLTQAFGKRLSQFTADAWVGVYMRCRRKPAECFACFTEKAPFAYTFRCLRMENMLPSAPTSAPPARLYVRMVGQTASTGTMAVPMSSCHNPPSVLEACTT